MFVDLDSTTTTSAWVLEAVAGACDAKQPAFIRHACEMPDGEHVPAAAQVRFAKRYHGVHAKADAPKTLELALPVDELGKGHLFAMVPSPITCKGTACMYAPTVTVVAKLTHEVDAAQVADISFEFSVDGMWRDRQWWGPRASSITAVLWDAHGARLGDATISAGTPHR